MVLKPARFFGEEPQVEIEDKNHATLEMSVAKALATSGGVDASDVHVTAKGSMIVLSGMVATPVEVGRAAEVATAVAGVASVTNQIVVG
jgi:osmotically-inducible protein OsmY